MWTHHSKYPVEDEVDADVGAGRHVHNRTYGAEVKNGGQSLQELGLAGLRTVQKRGRAQNWHEKSTDWNLFPSDYTNCRRCNKNLPGMRRSNVTGANLKHCCDKDTSIKSVHFHFLKYMSFSMYINLITHFTLNVLYHQCRILGHCAEIMFILHTCPPLCLYPCRHTEPVLVYFSVLCECSNYL